MINYSHYLQIGILLANFLIFVYVESIATHARYAGAVEGCVAIGITIHSGVLAMNRFLGFCIGPQIAYLVDSGVQAHEIFQLAIICFLGSGLLTILSVKKHKLIFLFLRSMVRKIRDSKKFMMRNYIWSGLIQNEKEIDRYHKYGIQINVFIISALIGSLYYGVSFFLGLVAVNNMNYRGTILQLTGVVTGIGSLLLNFYIFPKLTHDEINNKYESTYKSIILGKSFGLIVIANIILVSAYIFGK